MPPPSLIDVTPALEAAAEVQGHDSSTPELPAHEAEADIPPRPIINDKLFDTEAWREAGCAELLASISLPGAALCPIASSRLSTDSSGRGGGLRVPPPSLLDVTPHVDETDVSACKATPSSAEEPLSVYEEIQMAAELAETIADAYSGKQLSLSSLLRATSGVDMLMTLNLPEMQLLSTSTARDALAEMHDKMSYPIAVARLSSDGNGRGGGLRVAPPSLVDFTTDEEAAVELTSSGTDAALVFRSKTIALQPGSSLPLRLGIYPRTASAPTQDLPWESPRMSVEARLAAVSDLRSRTADTASPPASPPPSPPEELTAIEYMDVEGEDDDEEGLSNGVGCSVPDAVALALRSELRRLNGDAAGGTGYLEMLGLMKRLVERYRTHGKSAYATSSSVKPISATSEDEIEATHSPRDQPQSQSRDTRLILTKEGADAVLPLIVACEVELSLLGMASAASPPTLLPDDLHDLVAAAVGGRETRLQVAVHKGRWLAWIPRQRPTRIAVAAEDEKGDGKRPDKLALLEVTKDDHSATAPAIAAAVGGQKTRLQVAVRKGRWLALLPRQSARIAVAAQDEIGDGNQSEKLALLHIVDDGHSAPAPAAAPAIEGERVTSGLHTRPVPPSSNGSSTGSRVAWNDDLEAPVLRTPSRPATSEAADPAEWKVTPLLPESSGPASDSMEAIEELPTAFSVDQAAEPQPTILPSPYQPGAQPANAGSDVVTRRPNTCECGLHAANEPVAESPLRLGIYPRAVTAGGGPAQSLGSSWESPRMSVEARLAAVSDLRLRTAETVAAAQEEEATRQEVDNLSARITALEEREEIKQQLEQSERELQVMQADDAEFYAARLNKRANRLVAVPPARRTVAPPAAAGPSSSTSQPPAEPAASSPPSPPQLTPRGWEPVVLTSVLSDELLDALPSHASDPPPAGVAAKAAAREAREAPEQPLQEALAKIVADAVTEAASRIVAEAVPEAVNEAKAALKEARLEAQLGETDEGKQDAREQVRALEDRLAWLQQL